VKTITLNAPGELSLQEATPPDSIHKDEALVQVLRVGICGTDIHAFEGKQPFFSYPRIIGHELAVKVLELGEDSHKYHVSVGDVCAVEPYINCEACAACLSGTPNACMHMQVLGVHQDGGMRETMVVPIRKLHPANQLPLESLALVEMLSIGAHAVRRAQIDKTDTVLVIGAGPIGMGTMLFARLMNARVIAMDVSPGRLAFCKDVLGIQDIIDARENPLETLRSMTESLPTTVIDATGSVKSMTDAFHYVVHGGKLVYVGLVSANITFNDPHFHSHELTLLASRNATSEDFEWVINSLSEGTVSLDGWITHSISAGDFPEAFPEWLKPDSGLIKGMLTF
jgi:2-desacetyl-2-hydroxyethyl bacteriochlorophyllide A dehydrogenase